MRGTGQHRDTIAEQGGRPVDPRPEPGPITLLPDAVPAFEHAVQEAGGEVVPLSEQTRGVVWTADNHPELLTEALERHPQIGWVQLPWAGVDAFAEVLQRYAGGRPLFTSAKGAYSEPVAEQALALTLATLRRLPDKARTPAWERPKRAASLYGSKVVIVGAGGIAAELVRLLAPFETEITVVRRSSSELPGVSRTVTAERLVEVLPDADAVVLAAAATSRTRRLIGEGELAAMKPSAVLVNIARGSLVDTGALLTALRRGDIAGAGLDVTDPEPLPDAHPLWTAPNCIVTSHTADTEEMTRPLLAGRIAANVRAFLDTGEFVGVVDTKEGY